jgi:phytoene dehydrogenase-like protein
MERFDAIVIGSGPNGLAAAIRLSQKGWKTLVLEAADTPGGGARTGELTLPGFRHDVCSAVHPMAIGSPFFRTLDLERHGLRWLQPDVAVAHPLDDRRAVAVRRDPVATARELGEDEAAYLSTLKPLIDRVEELFGDALAPLRIPDHPVLLARLGWTAWRSATGFAKRFQGEPARALIAGHAAHAVLPLEAFASSAIGIMLLVAAHGYGWPVPEGGASAITDALVRVLHSLGGELRCGVAVRSLGELPPAAAYLFDVAPRNLAAIGDDALPAGYRRRLLAYRHGPGVFKVDYALSAPIPWDNPVCREAGTVHVGGTLEEIAASERAPWDGTLSDRPFVIVTQPSLLDRTRAPEGKHVAWAYCHVPHGSSVDRREAIDGQIERFAPGFRDCILAAHTMSCADLEAYNANNIGGDIVGGVTDWRQLFTRPVVRSNPYTTPNDRIFICSASTPPGGGVHGMCGYWAAEAVLARLSTGRTSSS